MHRHRTLALVAAALALQGCNDPPPSWQQLLAGKIGEQFPAYSTSPAEGGNLVVHRPGKPDFAVDVNAIAQFCRRGPADCDYATDQMLLQLRQ